MRERGRLNTDTGKGDCVLVFQKLSTLHPPRSLLVKKPKELLVQLETQSPFSHSFAPFGFFAFFSRFSSDKPCEKVTE